MKRKTAKSISVIALICSAFPVLSYLLAVLRITLAGEMRTALAGMNVVCALLGLGLSIACGKNKETRSAVNILSTIASAFWVLMIVGFLALALILSWIG